MRVKSLIVLGVVLALAACSGSDDRAHDQADAAADSSAELRLNQLQLEATHNSYPVEKPGTTVPDWKYSEELSINGR